MNKSEKYKNVIDEVLKHNSEIENIIFLDEYDDMDIFFKNSKEPFTYNEFTYGSKDYFFFKGVLGELIDIKYGNEN